METDCVDEKIILFPFVSIVVPALNEQSNIGQCIKGILQLDYPSERVEIVVVDNGSVDGTREVASFLGAKVFEVTGVTVAGLRNFGANKSKGEYIAFLDADCIPSENWLSETASLFERIPDTVVVGGTLTLPRHRPIPWVERYWVDYLNSKFDNDLECVDTLSSFCFVIKREIFDMVSGFNESLVTCEDYDLGYRLKEYGKIVINRKIKIIHLGNSKSLYAFWKRQVWQGRSNLHNMFAHKISVSELPSIVIPAVYMIIFMAFIVSLFLSGPQWFLARIVFMSIVVFIPGIKAARYKGQHVYRSFVGYWILWSIYLLARGFSAVLPRIK